MIYNNLCGLQTFTLNYTRISGTLWDFVDAQENDAAAANGSYPQHVIRAITVDQYPIFEISG